MHIAIIVKQLSVVKRKMSGMGVILCERKILIRLNLKINGADRRENLLFVNYFLGEENISFFRWGKLIFCLPHLILTFAQNSQGGRGPPGMLRGGARGLLPTPCVRYCSYFHRGLTFLLFQSSMFQVLQD